MNSQLISPVARQAVAVGRRNHWRFRVVGQGDLPIEPLCISPWWFETLTEVPTMAQDRLQALETADIKVNGVMIAHEAPKLLIAPKTIPVKEEPKPDSKIAPILPELGKVVLVVAELLLFFTTMVFSAILIDPAIVVVLEDGSWLEIMTYYE